MIRNYVKIASRNIVKRRLYSFINTVGLSIAIAFCILVYLFIRDERSFDQFNVNKNDIYRVDNRAFDYAAFKRGEKQPFSQTPRQKSRLGEAMLEELAAAKAMTRYSDGQQGLLTYKHKVFSERFTAVDSGFFDMFPLRSLAFLDEAIAVQYQSYQRRMNIMAFATGFAILISWLPVYLDSFAQFLST